MGFDIYADDKEPISVIESVEVKVVVPMPSGTPYNETAWAILNVELTNGPPNLVEFPNWFWFGEKAPSNGRYNSENWHLLDTRKKMLNWLKEWEFIELRSIGPEDSEYFATDKLMAIIDKRGV